MTFRARSPMTPIGKIAPDYKKGALLTQIWCPHEKSSLSTKSSIFLQKLFNITYVERFCCKGQSGTCETANLLLEILQSKAIVRVQFLVTKGFAVFQGLNYSPPRKTKQVIQVIAEQKPLVTANGNCTLVLLKLYFGMTWML